MGLVERLVPFHVKALLDNFLSLILLVEVVLNHPHRLNIPLARYTVLQSCTYRVRRDCRSNFQHDMIRLISCVSNGLADGILFLRGAPFELLFEAQSVVEGICTLSIL